MTDFHSEQFDYDRSGDRTRDLKHRSMLTIPLRHCSCTQCFCLCHHRYHDKEASPKRRFCGIPLLQTVLLLSIPEMSLHLLLFMSTLSFSKPKGRPDYWYFWNISQSWLLESRTKIIFFEFVLFRVFSLCKNRFLIISFFHYCNIVLPVCLFAPFYLFLF